VDRNASFAIGYTKHDLDDTVAMDTDYFFGMTSSVNQTITVLDCFECCCIV